MLPEWMYITLQLLYETHFTDTLIVTHPEVDHMSSVQKSLKKLLTITKESGHPELFRSRIYN
jgi:hypothetical protein